MWSVILGSVALLIKYRLTCTNERKWKKRTMLTHILCLRFKLISSSNDSDDLSVGFRRDITTS